MLPLTLLLPFVTPTSATPIGGFPTVESTPIPTLALRPRAESSEEAEEAAPEGVQPDTERQLTLWLTRTNPDPAVELVRVQTSGDAIVLEGTVGSEAREARIHAEAIAMAGVDVVRSSLVVDASRGASDDASSADTTEQVDAVRAALLDSPLVDPRSIVIHTDSVGRIQLSGAVGSVEERAIARRVARDAAAQPVETDLIVRR